MAPSVVGGDGNRLEIDPGREYEHRPCVGIPGRCRFRAQLEEPRAQRWEELDPSGADQRRLRVGDRPEPPLAAPTVERVAGSTRPADRLHELGGPSQRLLRRDIPVHTGVEFPISGPDTHGQLTGHPVDPADLQTDDFGDEVTEVVDGDGPDGLEKAAVSLGRRREQRNTRQRRRGSPSERCLVEDRHRYMPEILGVPGQHRRLIDGRDDLDRPFPTSGPCQDRPESKRTALETVVLFGHGQEHCQPLTVVDGGCEGTRGRLR